MANRDPSQGRNANGTLNDHGLAQSLKELFRTDNNDDVLQQVQALYNESETKGHHLQEPDPTATQQQAPPRRSNR